MATKSLKKIAVNAATDIGGLTRTRFEKLESAYGVIKAADYASGDTISFDAIPSQKIIYARLAVAGAAGLEYVYSDTNISGSPLALTIAGGAKKDIAYFIQYARGAGNVGGALLANTYNPATGTGEISREGEVLSVTVTVTA